MYYDLISKKYISNLDPWKEDKTRYFIQGQDNEICLKGNELYVNDKFVFNFLKINDLIISGENNKIKVLNSKGFSILVQGKDNSLDLEKSDFTILETDNTYISVNSCSKVDNMYITNSNIINSGVINNLNTYYSSVYNFGIINNLIEKSTKITNNQKIINLIDPKKEFSVDNSPVIDLSKDKKISIYSNYLSVKDKIEKLSSKKISTSDANISVSQYEDSLLITGNNNTIVCSGVFMQGLKVCGDNNYVITNIEYLKDLFVIGKENKVYNIKDIEYCNIEGKDNLFSNYNLNGSKDSEVINLFQKGGYLKNNSMLNYVNLSDVILENNGWIEYLSINNKINVINPGKGSLLEIKKGTKFNNYIVDFLKLFNQWNCIKYIDQRN